MLIHHTADFGRAFKRSGRFCAEFGAGRPDHATKVEAATGTLRYGMRGGIGTGRVCAGFVQEMIFVL
ncbi:hypothetical protein ASG39_03300 [Rhizobium sp. Leaf371]|nr:hypothetical protein ASG39_03300 [Rhizobium sp. Leaf371]